MTRPASDSSVARRRISRQISSRGTSPGRSARSSRIMPATVRSTASVRTQSGQMQVTEIRSLSHSDPSAVVTATTPAFAAAYSTARYGPRTSPATEDTFTIEPPPRRRIGSSTAWMPNMTPRRLTSSTSPQRSEDVSGKFGGRWPPALLTSTSTSPAVSTTRRQSSSHATSAMHGVTAPSRSETTSSSPSCSSSRSVARTCAPSAANASVVARPMPQAAPVTMAVFPARSGSASFRDRVQAGADLLGVAAELLEPRQLGEAAEAEDAFEERRRAVADGAAHGGVSSRFAEQAPFHEPRDGGVRRDAADARNVRPRARAEVRDDCKRLERRLGQPALGRLAEQARARLRRVASGAEGVTAGDVLEHDAAASLAVTLAQQRKCRLHPLGLVLDRRRKLLDAQWLGRDDEQRLDRVGEAVDRIGRDQAERSVDVALLSRPAEVSSPARDTRIGANGADCEIVTSLRLRSSSNARKRSRKTDTGGKRSAMCATETGGGSTASARSAAASWSGSCTASVGSSLGASGAGPSRK